MSIFDTCNNQGLHQGRTRENIAPHQSMLASPLEGEKLFGDLPFIVPCWSHFNPLVGRVSPPLENAWRLP